MSDRIEGLERLRQQTEDARLDDHEAAAIRRRVLAAQPSRSSAWLPAAAALAAGLVAVAFILRPSPMSVDVASNASCLSGDADRIETSADCEGPVVVRLGDDVVSLGPSTALGLGATPELFDGRARFRVAKRGPETAPFEVRFAAGVIVVLGTVFEIDQHGDAGEVRLESGRIEVRWDDGGPATRLEPGDRASWPRAPEEEPPPEAEPRDPRDGPAPPNLHPPGVKLPPRRAPRPKPRAAEPRAPVAPTKTVRQVMARLLQLRSQRRYADAITLLEATLQRADVDRTQRERLSGELGKLLDRAGRDPCPHWRTHAEQFPGPAADAALTSCR